jgi:hypothetical protein
MLREVALMVQLSFEPALDPYHTMFRALRLLPIIIPIGKLERDHVRILDFYLVFPFKIPDLRLKQEHRRLRSLGTRYATQKPYAEQPESAQLLQRMGPISDAAFQSLAAKGFVDGSEYDTGWVKPIEKWIPDDLKDRINAANSAQQDLMDFLSTLAREYDLGGENGLKHRSGLMEHRYDAV